MTLVTRRTFLQSAFASSVVLTTESMGNLSWVHSNSDPIRIAIGGLGSAGLHQMELFSAIPAAQIAALFDPNVQHLRSAVERLKQRDYPAPRTTTWLGNVLNDSSIHAISITEAFPGPLYPLEPVLASRKHILFDNPRAASFKEAVSTHRSIRSAKTIIRGRLGERFSPDARFLYPTAPAVRDIGPLIEAVITSHVGTRLNWAASATPVTACIQLLLACAVKSENLLALTEKPASYPVAVTSTAGVALITFPDHFGSLKKIHFNPLGGRIAYTSLLMKGRRGRVTCHASSEANNEVAVRNAIEFLSAIRSSPAQTDPTVQPAFLAAGLTGLILQGGGSAYI